MKKKTVFEIAQAHVQHLADREARVAEGEAFLREFEATVAREGAAKPQASAVERAQRASMIPETATTTETAALGDVALYDRFKAADPVERAKMMADPKIAPRLKAESGRRISAERERWRISALTLAEDRAKSSGDVALYDHFKAADPVESAKMMADPKIAPRLKAESARRISAANATA
jgi:hypothetical protein